MSNFRTPRKGTLYKTPSSYKTSSDENLSDQEPGVLSIVAEYDAIVRINNAVKADYMKMSEFIENYSAETLLMFESLTKAREEILQMQAKLDAVQSEKNDLDFKLDTARKLLDLERKRTNKASKDRDCLLYKFRQIQQMVEQDEHKKVTNEVWNAIRNMTVKPLPSDAHLSIIPEVNSTGSILSDLSYSMSENEIDLSFFAGKTWKKHRPSTEPDPPQKRRRSGGKCVEISSNDTVRATTTLTVPKHGPITATSVIESVPVPSAPAPENDCADNAPSAPPFNQVFEQFAGESLNGRPDEPKAKTMSRFDRQHQLFQRFLVMPLDCACCKKKIRFGKPVLKCKECKLNCHPDCKEKMPMPCIPGQSTPNRGVVGFVSDYVGINPPFVPAIIMRCVKEIEACGLDEIGLYRVPGSERDVKALKEKMLRSKNPVDLSDVDVNVLCGVVKDFLRGLREPLIPSGHKAGFLRALEAPDVGQLNAAIMRLPKANQDTLAFLMRHCQRISNSPACKMSVNNLSKIFGPTLVAYTESDNLSKMGLLTQTQQAIQIVETLMNMPADYWDGFFTISGPPMGNRLEQTVSTDSLLLRGIATPRREFSKKKRFFPTPPSIK